MKGSPPPVEIGTHGFKIDRGILSFLSVDYRNQRFSLNMIWNPESKDFADGGKNIYVAYIFVYSDSREPGKIKNERDMNCAVISKIGMSLLPMIPQSFSMVCCKNYKSFL
ncbi:hypothetical protein ES703_111577 [subsurface metagenome]